MKPEITVYTKTACQQCRMTERRLNESGVSYATADATEPANLEYIKGLGHLQAPVVVAGTESWAGYRPELIDALTERLKEGK